MDGTDVMCTTTTSGGEGGTTTHLSSLPSSTNWKLERQQNQTFSHQTTRVLQSHVRLSSARTLEICGGFPSLSEMDPVGQESEFLEAMRQKMRMSADNFNTRNGGMSNQFLINGGVNIGGIRDPLLVDNMEANMTVIQGQAQGQRKGDKTQVFADSRSASIQGTLPTGGAQILIEPQVRWQDENFRQQRLMNENEILLSAPSVQRKIFVTNSASALGITRSYSSNSGFPQPSTNPQFDLLSQSHNPSNETNDMTDEALMLMKRSDQIIPLSPRRNPVFKFRNFDGGTFCNENNLPFGSELLKENRKTWDPSSDRITRTEIQFSASQCQQVFESLSNGSFKASAHQDRIFLHQCYGPSESEESDDDDNDFVLGAARIKPSISYKTRLAILNKPAAPSEDDTTSSVGQSEIDILENDTNDELNFVEHQSPSSTSPENNQKAFRVAEELIETERTYVRILHLIDQIFHFKVAQENRSQQMFPPETLNQIFCNVKSIYTLHHDHLLPRLEERIERWSDDPRIGDIMVEFSPFLKMYSEYVQNFDNSLNLINYYRDKNVRFGNVINDIQSMAECCNLPIQHHLIAPIQRIPRYRLLLEAYLKRLRSDSNDKKDTEEALNIVSKAAEHANEAMRRIVSFKKLLEAQEQIRGVMDLVSPTRFLIKEGKINKISARTSESSVRYLFLLSDMILLCSLRNTYLSGQKYQLRAKLDIAEVSVFQGDDLEIMNTFYIEDTTRKIELYTDREDEKRDWMESIYQAKVDLMERKSSLRLSDDFIHNLGVKEPPRIKKDIQMKCMICDITFTMLKRRKHHCHACGIVICAKCSTSKFPLQYANGKLSRVCDPCKIILQGKEAEKRKSGNATMGGSDDGNCLSSPDDPADRIHGVLDVSVIEPSVLSGYLNLRLRGRKEWGQAKDTWIPRYFALRRDFVLYSYSRHTDEKALCATPIPGMSIQMVEDLNKSETVSIPLNDRERSFRLAHNHGRKSFFFCGSTKEDSLNWVNHLVLASRADFSPICLQKQEET